MTYYTRPHLLPQQDLHPILYHLACYDAVFIVKIVSMYNMNCGSLCQRATDYSLELRPHFVEYWDYGRSSCGNVVNIALDIDHPVEVLVLAAISVAILLGCSIIGRFLVSSGSLISSKSSSF